MAGKRKAKPRRKNRAGQGLDFVENAELNDRQRLFVTYYLETLNGGDAARRAGYSEKSAYQLASLLLRNVKVRAAIDEGMKARAMGADEVLARLSAIARIDFTGFTDANGDLDLKTARANGLMRFVKKLTVRTTGTGKKQTVTRAIEIQDVQGALVKIGERHRLWRQDDKGPSDGKEKPATLTEYLAKLAERERAQRQGGAVAKPPATTETVH